MPDATLIAAVLTASPPTAPERSSGQPDPYTRYFARVDAELEGKSRQFTRRFLEVQRTKFLADYARFTEDVDAGRPRPMENAADYTCIIAELGARLARVAS